MAPLHPQSRYRSSTAAPGLDRFGTCVVVAMLMTAATAVFVLRQNLDDHVFNLAAAPAASTTGAAVAE